MELRRLRYFLTVAEERNFGRAARRLQMAQPPLSRQVRALESELGVRLLQRTRRGVDLTDAGSVFLAEVRGVLAQVERARREARRVGAGDAGHLSIGLSPPTELSLLPRIVPAFARRYPDAQLDIHRLSDAEQPLALQNRTIQVGFLVTPIASHDDLTVEPLFRESLAVALPMRHPLARRRRLSPKDLARHPLVMFRRDAAPRLHDLVVEWFGRGRLPLPTGHEVGDLHTCLAVVATGGALTIAPASSRAICATGVVYRSLTPPVPAMELAAVYRRGHGSEITASFLSTLRNSSTLRNRRAPAARGRRR